MEKEEEYIFTPVQKANSILWFAESGSIESAQNLFCQHYGSNKQVFSMPSKQLIYEWYNNFRNTGFTDESTRQHNMLDESTDMNFCPVPYLSLIGKMEGDKTIPVQSGQKEHTEPKIFHPYTMFLTKKLYIEDAKERTMFAKKELECLHNNLHLLDSIWFTGEATFHTNGHVEVHNMRYANKNEAINPDGEEISSTDSVIVWAALNATGLLGPYFFLGDVTSDSYQMMLREFFYDVRQRISVHENPIFMHDDAPAHRKLNIQDFLEHEVPHHWIGTGSNYATWPHHSPDISPLNYFLWGFIKSHVYKTPLEPGDKNELMHRISVAFKKVHSKMLKEVVEDYKVRLEKLLETKGALIETSVNVRYDQHSLSTNINRSNNCFIDWQDDNTDNDEIRLS